MKVAGIDFNTKEAHVVTLPWDGNDISDVVGADHYVAKYAAQDPAGLAWFYSCLRVRPALAQIPWRDEEIELCFVERPVGPGRDKMLPLFGAIIAAIPRDTTVVSFLAVSEWRREFIGAGNASKVAVAGKAIQLGFPRDWPEDRYEALGIAWAGRSLNANGIAQARSAA